MLFRSGVVARQTDEAHLMTWGEFTPQQVLADVSRLLKNPAVKLDGGWPQYYTVSDRAPLAMAFTTRNHQKGVLQILGNSDNPPGVKIRYKLVQPAANVLTDAVLTLAAQPPVVVETFPLAGARDVPAGETEIRVRFSKPMADRCWSWCYAWEGSMPEYIGEPHYEPDGKTCVLKVKLEPGRTYAYWLNHTLSQSFMSRAGQPAVPYLLVFKTK